MLESELSNSESLSESADCDDDENLNHGGPGGRYVQYNTGIQS